MTWKCDICDTYNEASQKTCYVCSQPRSEASLREAKRRAKEERGIKVSRAVYEKSYGILKAAFLTGCFSSIAVIVILIIIRLVQGDVAGIATNLGEVLQHMGMKLAATVTVNVPETFREILSDSDADLFRNMGALWEKCISDPVQSGAGAGVISNLGYLRNTAAGHFADVAGMIQHVVGNIQQFF